MTGSKVKAATKKRGARRGGRRPARHTTCICVNGPETTCPVHGPELLFRERDDDDFSNLPIPPWARLLSAKADKLRGELVYLGEIANALLAHVRAQPAGPQAADLAELRRSEDGERCTDCVLTPRGTVSPCPKHGAEGGGYKT